MARMFSLSGGGRGWWTVDDSRAGAGETFQGKRRSQYTPSANYPLSLYETIEEYASRTPRVLNPPDVIEDPLFEKVRVAAKQFLKIADPLCSGGAVTGGRGGDYHCCWPPQGSARALVSACG